ncbi:hypothetical protein Rsub_03243 [Raphidocelis subcapitata]|uniref:Uncharacterized protein n=1 Tax=Raphidocelis subcapitata TaxID=307507 RepID=A0A2V0NSQ9_9CHLO|nr:hypothetical protein Rsub_03243 [Raphidocelis subcapitata]|eukprot:GBF90671.1 hypothetical protein Rsub_03243 [Raphidocelis subcapitata]
MAEQPARAGRDDRAGAGETPGGSTQSPIDARFNTQAPGAGGAEVEAGAPANPPGAVPQPQHAEPQVPRHMEQSGEASAPRPQETAKPARAAADTAAEAAAAQGIDPTTLPAEPRFEGHGPILMAPARADPVATAKAAAGEAVPPAAIQQAHEAGRAAPEQVRAPHAEAPGGTLQAVRTAAATVASAAVTAAASAVEGLRGVVDVLQAGSPGGGEGEAAAAGAPAREAVAPADAPAPAAGGLEVLLLGAAAKEEERAAAAQEEGCEEADEGGIVGRLAAMELGTGGPQGSAGRGSAGALTDEVADEGGIEGRPASARPMERDELPPAVAFT